MLAAAWWLLSPLFLDRTVNEPPPKETQRILGEKRDGKTASMPAADVRQKEMESDKAEEAGTENEEPVWTGMFTDGDDFHKASGTVRTIDAGEKRYIRFEQFETTNGPDLFVILVKEGMNTGDGIRLGKLKGNKGDQQYEIPQDVDLAEYNKVVIWCRAFRVDFGYAVLTSN